MNLWTLRCGCRFGEARERDATNPSRPLFQFQRFPTRVTLHDEIVVGERCLSVMGLWLKVADQNLLEADFTRVLSDCAYINRDNHAFLTLLLHTHLHVVSTQGSRQSAPPSPAFKHQ